jgi:hypothetical protein
MCIAQPRSFSDRFPGWAPFGLPETLDATPLRIETLDGGLARPERGLDH